ncbi:hypothetical protein [Halorarius litoreus]|uniref:hypothetical protein n=1 Tax=Halorarius litoreus TaxID=2962676 RepID=UPI0020CD542A|nr:hypothetical protein [Halorarius litoreus]
MDDRLQFAALYLTRFAGGFGLATLATLLPTYINLYDPSGLVIGLFTAAFTLVQTAAIVPIEGLATLTPASLPLVACNALLGVADAFREPASMALFADEGGGVAASFDIREFVW